MKQREPPRANKGLINPLTNTTTKWVKNHPFSGKMSFHRWLKAFDNLLTPLSPMTKTFDNRKINVFKDGHCPPPGSVLANWAPFLPLSVVSRCFGMNVARKTLSHSVVSIFAGNWFCCFCCRVSIAVGLQFELLCGVCSLIRLFILLWNEDKVVTVMIKSGKRYSFG